MQLPWKSTVFGYSPKIGQNVTSWRFVKSSPKDLPENPDKIIAKNCILVCMCGVCVCLQYKLLENWMILFGQVRLDIVSVSYRLRICFVSVRSPTT